MNMKLRKSRLDSCCSGSAKAERAKVEMTAAPQKLETALPLTRNAHWQRRQPKEGLSRLLRTPVRMLPRVYAPAQSVEVEVPRISEEVPQPHEEAVGNVSQPKDSNVLTPALRATSTHGVLGAGSRHAIDLMFVLE